MSRKRDRSQSQEFDRARDELFSHIHRCGVLRSAEDHQVEWMTDTVDYLGERYSALGGEDLEELKQIGMRFCRPVIPYTEETAEETAPGEKEPAASEAAAA